MNRLAVRLHQQKLRTHLGGGRYVFADFEIWLVTLTVAISMFSARVLPVALGVAAVFWLMRYLAHGRLGVRTPADAAIMLLVVTLPVSLWCTSLPDVTRPAVLYVLAGTALYYAIVNWASSRDRLRLMIIGMAGTGLVLALSAPFSVDWTEGSKYLFQWPSLYHHFPPLVSNLVHPNVLVGPLVLILPASAAMLVFNGYRLDWRERLLAALTVLAIPCVVLLAQSRGGLLALGTGFAVVILLRWRWSWLLILPAVLVVLITLRHGIVEAPFNGSVSREAFDGFDYRLMVWSWALHMLGDLPWTGIGMGTFGPTAYALYAPHDVVQIPHAHNLFLQVGVDLGLIGLIAWLAMVMLVTLAGWRVYRYGRTVGNGWLIGLGAGVLGSQGALVSHGLLDAVTWGVEPAVITWAIWGIAMAAWNWIEREQTLRQS